MTKQIISVWHDTTSDQHGWIVDTDIDGGGMSATVKVFPDTDDGREQAVAFANDLGAKRGLPVRVQ